MGIRNWLGLEASEEDLVLYDKHLAKILSKKDEDEDDDLIDDFDVYYEGAMSYDVGAASRLTWLALNKLSEYGDNNWSKREISAWWKRCEETCKLKGINIEEIKKFQ